MKFMRLLPLLALAGCVTQATLIARDGPHYLLHVDPIGKRLNTEIDGVPYTGTFVKNEMIGFGSAQSFGARPMTSTGLMVGAGSNGQAVLTSQKGDYIECAFNANGMSVVGKCRSNKGREFILTTG